MIHIYNVVNRRYRFMLVLPFVFFTLNFCYAGPPFNTDDPEPVEFKHWEFYLSSAMNFDKADFNATLPHFEVNYGLIPNVQVHLLIPVEYTRTSDNHNYGIGNTELGFKYRFYKDSSDFQIGIFPLVEVPTSGKWEHIGHSNFQIYLPLWLQKSWGKLTTYGGTGIWYNSRTQQQNWLYVGWECQYSFSELITLGGELYYQTASKKSGESDMGFNMGGFIDLSGKYHILFSLGHSLMSSNSYFVYFGYLFTI